MIVYSCPAKNGKMARPKLMVKLKRIGHDDLANSTIEAPEKSSSKIYHDESLTSFFRRLQFSPDGLLLVTPAAVSIRNAFSCVAPAQADSKKVNTSLVYGRNSLKSKIPLLELPVPSCRPTVTVKFSPIIYKLRKDVDPIIPLPYRMIFAVACQDAVIIYDTQQAPPIAATTGLHYATLTDIAWSDDGLVLIIASTDGFCSVLFFSQSDLGDEWKGSLMHPAPERPNVDRYTASQS